MAIRMGMDVLFLLRNDEGLMELVTGRFSRCTYRSNLASHKKIPRWQNLNKVSLNSVPAGIKRSPQLNCTNSINSKVVLQRTIDAYQVRYMRRG